MLLPTNNFGLTAEEWYRDCEFYTVIIRYIAKAKLFFLPLCYSKDGLGNIKSASTADLVAQ